MPLVLRWRSATTQTVEAEALRPDALAAHPTADIARLTLPVGSGSAELGELFHVEGDSSDGCVQVEGDLRRVHRLGAGMAAGTLMVRGDVGAHVGAGMIGGTLDVTGSAGPWAGAEMQGGLLRIQGSAGDGLGSAYAGSRRGMREGVILVEGSAGSDVGLAMRRGLIALAGRAGDGLGRAMIAGSIFTFGPVGRFPGMGMKRGTLALFGLDRPEPPPLLPTFLPSCRNRPPFLTIYLRQLSAWGFPVPQGAFSGSFQRYNGDLIDHGQGEVLVWNA
ncbi:MAG TPA: formylmethanofuran dehydrogenase subunit C [Isosphaeraceae bacterium]|jgi:formylmethanofuran dehydrogenase subunit C|nr:formylmethanofuran dehydrogenase subunit C [Isosphaeraceae bacterium]